MQSNKSPPVPFLIATATAAASLIFALGFITGYSYSAAECPASCAHRTLDASFAEDETNEQSEDESVDTEELLADDEILRELMESSEQFAALNEMLEELSARQTIMETTWPRNLTRGAAEGQSDEGWDDEEEPNRRRDVPRLNADGRTPHPIPMRYSTFEEYFEARRNGAPRWPDTVIPSSYKTYLGLPTSREGRAPNHPFPYGEDGYELDEDGEPPTDLSLFAFGSGEEDERTLFTSRTRIFHLSPSGWTPIALSTLRLKSSDRLVARLDNGTVVLNLRLHAALKPVVLGAKKRFLRITGVEGGIPQAWLLQIRSEEEVGRLQRLLGSPASRRVLLRDGVDELDGDGSDWKTWAT